MQAFSLINFIPSQSINLFMRLLTWLDLSAFAVFSVSVSVSSSKINLGGLLNVALPTCARAAFVAPALAMLVEDSVALHD